MAFTIEDGAGRINANALITDTEADAYFVDSGNTAWTGTAQEKQEAIVRATRFIEKRFGNRFAGERQFQDAGAARSVLTFTQQPANGETVTVNGFTLTFGTNVVIGVRLSLTIENLINQINASVTDIEAMALTGQRLMVKAGYVGEDGNLIAVASNVTGATWSSSTLVGGNDEQLPQALSFPRVNLYRPLSSQQVQGIPREIKEAVAEYAVRALTANLMPDPARDDTGNEVRFKKEKVGPIEEETGYQTGLQQAIPRYPAADKLISVFLIGGGSGGVCR